MGIETLLGYLVRIVEYEVIKYGPEIERAVIEKVKELADYLIGWAKQAIFGEDVKKLPPPSEDA